MGNDRSSVDPMLSSNRSNIVASSCMDNGYKKSIIFGSTILAKSVLLMVDKWVSHSPAGFFVNAHESAEDYSIPHTAPPMLHAAMVRTKYH